ncbi:MAG: hypothetical protein K2L12_06355 [Clostridia bacterium]|nr:hypothetical protein [Clostridia bacterium]
MTLLASEIIAKRVFNPLYIYLDIVFLVALCALLVVRKKYLTLLFGLFGGILYMIVDYGIFHLALHTRSIEGGNLFAVLLWMSMSYGITNFVWIWLWFSRDKFKFEWTLLIVIWWISVPMLANTFGSSLPLITIQRTTGSYHGYMALILFAGYAAAIIYNMFTAEKQYRLPLLWLLITGIAVQFGWEFSLLIGGIRSAGFESFSDKIMTLVVNSLLETNLGAVPIYCIYVLISARVEENLKKREKVTFKARIEELNNIKIIPHA